ncbi:hypothetical protein V5R04_10060 [Jonesiaceae bacterium BS-20]|uniref:Uncharacterized protein n=1 Tax=Jonesiaceae bacterium BS-20 TaxID=3120821 RepID=A0AAU7DTE1_9MICO
MTFESDTPTTPITPVPQDVWNTDSSPSAMNKNQAAEATTTQPFPTAQAATTGDLSNTSDAQVSEPKFSTKVRFTTITWGLILLAGGIGIMTLASGYIFDAELALIGLLAVAGFTLVGGSIVRAIRK